jgi:hypothetical protein
VSVELKLGNDNKRATPTELFSRLELSRLGYVSVVSDFDHVPSDLRLRLIEPKTLELEADHILVVMSVGANAKRNTSADKEEDALRAPL